MADPVSGTYSVQFSQTARVVEYSDPEGKIEFTFDIEKATQKLILEHFPLSLARPLRYDFAFAETIRFLETSGHAVRVYGTAILPEALNEEQVEVFVESQLPDPFPLAFRLVVPPRRTEMLSHKGPSWQLWLVAEAIDGAHRDSKIVFDEGSKQFGVANESNVFLGFWGSLDQTIAAIGTLP